MTPLGWRLDLTTRPELAQALRDAGACIGMHEQPMGSNRGPQVDQWLRLAGAEPGAPWCAAWVTALFDRIHPPPIPRLASALKIFEWASSHDRLVEDGAPLLPGDIGGLFHEGGVRGHVGIVVAVDEQLSCIEGNIASAVRPTVRPRSSWQWYVRPVAL